MDKKTYKPWWQLHLRVAKGETLSSAEQIEYDAGLNTLDEEEKEQFSPNSLTTLRYLRAEVEQLQISHDQLKTESTRLDNKIAVLEKAYQAATGYKLAV
jgi:hypothetical protein